MLRALAILLSMLQAGAADASSAPSVTKAQVPGRPKVVLAYTIVDPRQHRFALRSFGTGVEMRGVPDGIACSGVAMTGGFSKRAGRRLLPEGLLSDGDRSYSGIERWSSGGVFSLDSSSASITRIANWRRERPYRGVAVQGKPMLVFDGKVEGDLGAGMRQNRVAVGTLADGRIVMISALSPADGAATYAEFARLAVEAVPGLTALLNLDGGPSAFVFAASQGVRLFPGDGSITTYICAEGR